MVTDPCRSLATNPVNLRILLQSTTKSDYHSTTSRPSFRSSVGFHTPSCRPLVVDLFNLLSMYLPCQPPRPSTSTLPTSMTLLSRFLAFYWFQFIDLHGHTCLSIQIALHQAVCLSSQDYRILSPKPVYFCKQMTILYSLSSSNNSNYCRFDHNLFSIGFDCGHR
jgi:hypothetical protein